MARLADAVSNRNKCGLLSTRSRDNCGFPGELKVEAAVGSRDEKDDTEVASADIKGADQNSTARSRKDDWDDHVPERFLELAAGPGECASSGIRNRVWRCLDKVCY